MNKLEFKAAKEAEGYVIPDVASWQLVSADGLEPKRYDVNNVYDPEDMRYSSFSVIVENEGTAQENVIGAGRWLETFEKRIRTWLASREGATVGQETVFAISVEKVYNDEQIAIATAYMKGTGVREQKYVVKERNNTISFEAYA